MLTAKAVPMIEFSEVSKTFGQRKRKVTALDDVSFSVLEGELVLLIGPSGSGKSTMLRLILAMERPDGGTISVAGRNVHRLTRGSIPYLRRNVGAVFQDFKLLPEATPLENVSLALHILGLSRAEVSERAKTALISVGIDPILKKPTRVLSGGEQQRVALARSLVSDPSILLADEPTGNLDPELTRDVLDEVIEVQKRGTTVVLATHDPLVCSYVPATRILRLDNGKLVDNSVTPLLRAVSDRHARAEQEAAEAAAAVAQTELAPPKSQSKDGAENPDKKRVEAVA